MKAKDPKLFETINRFLTEYIPIIKRRDGDTVTAYKAGLNSFLNYVCKTNNYSLMEITVADFHSEIILGYLRKMTEDKYAVNIATDTTMPANTINFGGLAVTNNGVVSNVFVYYEGDVNINTKSTEGQVNIAGFVNQNSGKITYSCGTGNVYITSKRIQRRNVCDYQYGRFQLHRWW